MLYVKAVDLDQLWQSPRLKYAHEHRIPPTVGGQELPDLAEALTFGNSEVLVLVYDPTPHHQMQLFHWGS